MSARTPFFPSGGRQQDIPMNGDQQDHTKTLFAADKPNPLHMDLQTDINDPSNDRDKSLTEESGNKIPTDTDGNETRHKPFNVSGLIRSRTHNKPPQKVPAVPVNGSNTIVRPGTADPTRDSNHFTAHTTTIAAPTPFKASRMTPSLLMSTSTGDITARDSSPFNFKAPALPLVHRNEEPYPNNAHIPTETFHSTDISAHSRSINNLGNRPFPDRTLDRSGAEDGAHIANGQGPQQSLVNGQKRRQHDAETRGRSEQYQSHSKRLKQERGSGRNDTRAVRPDQDRYRYHRQASGEIQSGIDAETDGSLSHPEVEARSVEQQDVGELSSALDRLLGRNVNAYVEERLVEKYEQAVNKWRECTLEQWFAGAEEIKSKYSKIFDFVKDHVNSKINLYASLDKKIENHATTLTSQDEMLSGFRTRLIKDSESVLGRSLGM